MFKPGMRTAKLKTACKLCTSRIKLLRNKRTIQIDQMQKEIAELLSSNRRDYAWIRVEAIIREKNLLGTYEILELYLELVAVRAQLLDKSKECPNDMVEAVSSLFYASNRVSDLPELNEVRKLLGSKFSKDLGMEGSKSNLEEGSEPANWKVNYNIRGFLAVEAPEIEEKLSTISEIAQQFNVPFDLDEYSQSAMVQNDPRFHNTPKPPMESGEFPISPKVMSSPPNTIHFFQNHDDFPVPPYPAASDTESSTFPYPPPGNPNFQVPVSYPYGEYTNAMDAVTAAYKSAEAAKKYADMAANFSKKDIQKDRQNSMLPQYPSPQISSTINETDIRKRYDAAQGPPEKFNSDLGDENADQAPTAPVAGTSTVDNEEDEDDKQMNDIYARLAALRK